MLSSCLRAVKGTSQVPFCDYEEETKELRESVTKG